MTWHKSEEEVDKMIEEMSNRTKGKYITQGVSFNKTCPRQMAMLKMALMSSASFSGLIKELLALRMRGEVVSTPPKQQEVKPKNKNVGNFF
jgi:predicted CopG family antitoxin